MSIKVWLLVVVAILVIYPKELPEKEKQKVSIIGQIERLAVNYINMPLENNGNLGEDGQTWYPNGQTALSILFSGGPALSGYVNGDLRTAWMALGTRAAELQPGPWGTDPALPESKIYRVDNRVDTFGSQAYIDWQDAVTQGADFQDLNGDGLYDPNIDRPDIQGDLTFWHCTNDSIPTIERSRFQTMPMGLEIHQTTWGFEDQGALADILFIRYRLLNQLSDDMEGLIFSSWSDPDIGGYEDDLIASDPQNNLGFCYNDGSDSRYLNFPPALGLMLLQGPVVEAPGDTAFRYRGNFLGVDTILDRRNLDLRSFSYYISSDPVLGDPNTAQEARFYQEGGLDYRGMPIQPENWGVGGLNNPSPEFFYNGDPVSQSGWLDSVPADKRMMINVGEFDLAAGDTQDIIIAIVVGRGVDALDSVTKMRQNAAFLESNRGSLVGVSEDGTPTPLSSFSLAANYPNPFNPSTTIEFSLQEAGVVTLEIFNTLGQSVATLFSERRAAGQYSYTWNAAELPSGIYYYRLRGDGFSQTRKMLLLK